MPTRLSKCSTGSRRIRIELIFAESRGISWLSSYKDKRSIKFMSKLKPHKLLRHRFIAIWFFFWFSCCIQSKACFGVELLANLSHKTNVFRNFFWLDLTYCQFKLTLWESVNREIVFAWACDENKPCGLCLQAIEVARQLSQSRLALLCCQLAPAFLSIIKSHSQSSRLQFQFIHKTVVRRPINLRGRSDSDRIFKLRTT